MQPELFKNKDKEHNPEMITAVHESGHLVQLLLAGKVPEFVNIIPNKIHAGSVSGGSILIADVAQDWDQNWRYRIKCLYGGLIASAFYCGAYLYDRAHVDLELTEEERKLYGLTEGDLLECWISVHKDIKLHWGIIWEMSEKLFKEKLLGAEYYEELLLT